MRCRAQCTKWPRYSLHLKPSAVTPATGPPSLWMMTELQTLEGLDDAHRGAGYSCQLGSAEQGHAIGVWSNLSSISLLLHREVATVAARSRRSLSPESCPNTTQHNIRNLAESGKHQSVRPQTRQLVLAEVLQRSGSSWLPWGWEQSLVSSRPCTKALLSWFFISLIRHRLSSPSSGPLRAQTPLARCTAGVRRQHRVGQVLRSSRCLGSPGARALDFGFALHFFLMLPRQHIFSSSSGFSDCRKV